MKREPMKSKNQNLLAQKKARGNLLDYVRTLSPVEELASAVEKVSEKRSKTRLRSPVL